MNRRLDDESDLFDRYDPYYGRRSRVESSELARLDSRDCARNYIDRDARAFADTRAVNVRRRSRREQG